MTQPDEEIRTKLKKLLELLKGKNINVPKETVDAIEGDGVVNNPSFDSTVINDNIINDNVANGTTANGTTANGTTANGTTANGTTANGTTANGTTANSTVDGTVDDTTVVNRHAVNKQSYLSKASNLASESINKAKYFANLAANTSNINKLHLKNQFYLEYMDINTIQRVYYKDTIVPLTDDVINKNKDDLPKIIDKKRENIECMQGKVPGDYNFYLYEKESNTQTNGDKQNSDDGVSDNQLKAAEEVSNEQDSVYNKIALKEPPTMEYSKNRLTAFKLKLPFGRLNNAELIERDLYLGMETGLINKIKEANGDINKVKPLLIKLRTLYTKYVCFSEEFKDLYKYLHFYRFQLNTMLWGGTLVPFDLIDYMIDSTNDMVMKNDDARKKYINSMQLIFKTIAAMSYTNPGISSKFKEITKKIEAGEKMEDVIKQLEKKNKKEGDDIVDIGSGDSNGNDGSGGGDKIDKIDQRGGGNSEILIRLRDYYDIDFDIKQLDWYQTSSTAAFDLSNIQSHPYEQLDNTKLTGLKPLYAIYEAKYALLACLWVCDKLLLLDKKDEDKKEIEIENWLRFEQKVSNVLSNGDKILKLTGKRFYNIGKSIGKSIGKKTTETNSTQNIDLDTLSVQKQKIYKEWFESYKEDNYGSEPPQYKKNARLEYIRDRTYNYKIKYGTIYDEKMNEFFDKKSIEINGFGNIEIFQENGDWTKQFKDMTFTSILINLNKKETEINNLLKKYLIQKDNDTNATPPTTGGNKNKTQKIKRNNEMEGGLPNPLNVLKKAKNAASETYFKAKKQIGQFNDFYKILGCVFYTCVNNMNDRLMKKLSIMRDNKIINKQTGYTMQDNLILCIGKTMRYTMRISMLVCMAPLSTIIAEYTAGVLASPHCLSTSQVFSSILERSGVLTDRFAKELNKLLGTIVYNYEYDNKQKIENTLDINSNIEDLKTNYQYKCCLINDVFAGLLMDIRVENNENNETTYVFSFAVVDYNKEKTQLITNAKIEKLGKENMDNTIDNINVITGGQTVAPAGILLYNLVKGAVNKTQQIGSYEKKEIYITVKNDGNNIGEKITRVIPYVYACPTYYTEFSATTTINSIKSKLKNERIHTVINIREMEQRFKNKGYDPVDFDDFKYEYEYDGKYVGYIKYIKKTYYACVATSVTYCTYTLTTIDDKTIDVESYRSLHVIVPWNNPASDTEYPNSSKLICNIENNTTKPVYITSNYGNTFEKTPNIEIESKLDNETPEITDITEITKIIQVIDDELNKK
jgi:hypothetical protein